MKENKRRLTPICSIHYLKLALRTILFVLAIIVYVVDRRESPDELFSELGRSFWLLGIVWLIYAVDMAGRFFPARYESMGCQKQFKRNYKPTGEPLDNSCSENRTLVALLCWVLLNGIIGALYYLDVIDRGILILISLAYGVCDMICILFFCPFQTWILKNRCCTVCRIYNWDFAMMFTPLIFIPGIYTWSLLFMSLLLLARWEIAHKLHPEYFSDRTNACLSCASCKEKLGHHKKQLQGFIRKNRWRWKFKNK